MITSNNQYIANDLFSPVGFISKLLPYPNLWLSFMVLEPRRLAEPRALLNYRCYPVMRGEFERRLGQLQHLRECNEQFGVYFDGNFDQFYYCCAEIDNRSIEEQHAIFDRAPIEPNFRVQTRERVYGYWLLDRGYRLPEWQKAQKSLIDFTGSSEALYNKTYMLLPGFNEVYIDHSGCLVRSPVECVVFNPSRRYSVRQIVRAFADVEAASTEVV